MTPRPDLVTLLFMVARGIDDEEVQREQWTDVSLRASQQVDIFLGEGINSTTFRVLD